MARPVPANAFEALDGHGDAAQAGGRTYRRTGATAVRAMAAFGPAGFPPSRCRPSGMRASPVPDEAVPGLTSGRPDLKPAAVADGAEDSRLFPDPLRPDATLMDFRRAAQHLSAAADAAFGPDTAASMSGIKRGSGFFRDFFRIPIRAAHSFSTGLRTGAAARARRNLPSAGALTGGGGPPPAFRARAGGAVRKNYSVCFQRRLSGARRRRRARPSRRPAPPR